MPDELKMLCRDTKRAFLSLGKPGYDRKPAEEANLIFRRSIYFVKDLKEGEQITSKSIRRIRPGFGLEPKYEEELLGKRVKKDISSGTATSWELIDE